MKVVDFIKTKREILANNPLELKDWLSPSLRDYWMEFLNKANQTQLASQVRESLVSNGQATSAVNGSDAEQAIAVEPAKPAIELSAEAQAEYDTLLPQVGEEIHVGEWLHLDQKRINEFANVTMDHQWVHTDPERAASESPFKTTIAHGFLTLSLIPYLSDSVNPEQPQHPNAKMVVNYGLNQVRFPYPLKVGNNVRARTKLLSVTPIKRGLELVKEMKVEIEGCRRPACVTESVIRLYF
ncbi:MaoC family dehydratase [Aliagarivorans marinus]|uniref:MaoC family dehydratase n=1 Tax=Aliagarivorans marinus TaxID=561965 RepID=UPI0004267A98|nr:MaoC family dehydratase [Aliagarivorans marinus]